MSPLDPARTKRARAALAAATRQTFADDVEGCAEAIVETMRAATLLREADTTGRVTARAMAMIAAEVGR